MKVGDYVRTECGIAKCIRVIPIRENSFMYEFDSITYEDNEEKANFLTASELEKYKHSPNIIELFEEHDLVVIEYFSLRYEERVTRLFELDYKDEEFMTIKNAHCDFMLRNNEFNDEDKKLKPIIKSIVTKEQFESIEYKVGE